MYIFSMHMHKSILGITENKPLAIEKHTWLYFTYTKVKSEHKLLPKSIVSISTTEKSPLLIPGKIGKKTVYGLWKKSELLA